ncbi:MAG TPA: M23 family metallopeptidase [Myxococcota bacterium]|nr:M23 family metallopeptidase [Myxococcota bacterium]HRY92124.1 M23 family metallopeptidase [Myxococcota bacterium]
MIGLGALLAAAAGLGLTVSPSEPVQGAAFVVEVRGAEPEDEVQGTFLGRDLRFFVDGRGRVRALAAVPLGRRPGPAGLKVRVRPAGEGWTRLSAPVQVGAGKFERQTIRVNPKYVSPPARERKRIRREAAEMARLWAAPPGPRLWRGGFLWPRKDVLGSGFGTRRLFNGRLASRHYGVDIDGRLGDPVAAIGAGTVVMAAPDRYYSGGTLVVDHGLRLFSMYFHLSELLVEAGARVERGQILGKVGSSGRSTGPHLHLSVKLEGVTFDPHSLLALELEEDGPGGAAR